MDLEPQPIESLDYGATKFIEGDVTKMPFENDVFDFAFSFNSLEHFHYPKESLTEILRVIRPGGYLYFDFGPLYFAPKGLHLYNKIPIPYCQLIFEYETLKEYCINNNLGEPKYDVLKGLNGWSIEQYRKLWEELKSIATVEQYFENPTYKNLEIVEKYPQCFKNKFESVDNLLVTQIQILFRKK